MPVILWLCALLVCCGEGQTESPASDAGVQGRVSSPRSYAAELVGASSAIVDFLQGEIDVGAIRLADTVTLHLAPESGGGQSSIARDHLATPGNWTVRSGTGETHSFVPAPAMTQLTTRVGSHINCMEYSLASRVPALGEYPHVGTMLQPVGATSCLQTWNLTLVFEPDSRPPRLIAAVFDRWEW